MEKWKILIIVWCLLVISCQEKDKIRAVDSNKANFKKSQYFKEERITDNKYKIKYYGNDRSFGELELYYSYNKLRIEEILPYSLIMVEKHKKYKHCTTVFNYFIEFYTGEDFQYDGTEISLIKYLKNFEKLNQDQKDYLLYFIKLGVVKNDFGSINYWRLLNKEGIGIEKNLKKADSLNGVLNKFPRSIKGSI